MLKEKRETFIARFENNISDEFPIGTSILDILQRSDFPLSSPIVAALIDNEEFDLHYQPALDCNIKFISLNSEVGLRIYRRSLYFVLLKAARDKFSAEDLHIEHSLSTGVYCEVTDRQSFSEEEVADLEKRMREIIADKIPFLKKSFSKEEACRLILKGGHSCKVRLYKYNESNNVDMYKCGDIYENFNGVLVPHTGYLDKFRLQPYLSGFVLLFPDIKDINSIPEFKELPKLASTFCEYKSWAKSIEVDDVMDLNDQFTGGNEGDVIRVAEAHHEKKISQIADCIALDKDNVKLILIAGPSSSGKTTFTQRLAIQLKVNGLRTVSISLDDYFVNREKTPIDENGEYDFESIDALDLDLFNHHLYELIKGNEVTIPKFNFITGERESFGKKLSIGNNSILLIEGIHGLNERLSEKIPKEQKFKIYISALTQLNIDNHNIIPTTDTRLIRRIVRDYYFRGSSAKRTLQLWPSVRRGEEKNIFPFQEEADIMFNSFLLYELSVLKPHALTLLKEVEDDTEQSYEAKRLINILKYFISIDNNEIPTNSIIREFIGGCCFYQ